MSRFRLQGLNIEARTVFGIGRNYAGHARELGNEVPAAPIVFLKPVGSLVPSGTTQPLPRELERVDYEAEIVVAINRRACRVSEADALGCVAGYAIGLDLTARDLQAEAKKKGLPWTLAKGWDGFAPLGEFAPAALVPDPSRLTFFNDVGSTRRQSGRASEMIFSVPRVISYLSRMFTLDEGDIIFTGTPAGVGPLKPGDSVHAELQLDGKVLSTLRHQVV